MPPQFGHQPHIPDGDRVVHTGNVKRLDLLEKFPGPPQIELAVAINDQPNLIPHRLPNSFDSFDVYRNVLAAARRDDLILERAVSIRDNLSRHVPPIRTC